MKNCSTTTVTETLRLREQAQITTLEVARLLQIEEGEVIDFIREKTLPAKPQGRSWVVTAADLAVFLESKEEAARSPIS